MTPVLLGIAVYVFVQLAIGLLVSRFESSHAGHILMLRIGSLTPRLPRWCGRGGVGDNLC